MFHIKGTPFQLKLSDYQKFKDVNITAAASARAIQQVKKTQAIKREALTRKRSPQLQQQIDKLVELRIKTKETIKQKLVKPSENARDVLTRWAIRARVASPPRVFDAKGIYPSRRSIEAGRHPTRFIIETPSAMTLNVIIDRLRSAFGLIATLKLEEAGLAVEPLFRRYKTDRYFLLTLRSSRTETKRERYTIANALKKLGKFKTVVPERLETIIPFAGVDGSPEIPNDTEWHLKTMRVFEAWAKKPKGNGQQQGEGIVIAHPDTGWRDHPEFGGKGNPQIDRVRAKNIFTGAEGPNAALDPVETRIPGFMPGHGTATGSFIISAKAEADKTTVKTLPQKGKDAGTRVQITGVAPRSTLLPIRCVDSVILIGDVNVARAVEYAIDQKAHIISISLGGFPHHSLEDIITHAVRDHNLIVVAAGGQIVDDSAIASEAIPGLTRDSVVEPAAYRDVIGVAATTFANKPWGSTCYGPNIDICAPGVGVWCADLGRNKRNEIEGRVVWSEGSSFAAAAVAGIAALWLSFWSRDTLLAQYPNKPLAHVFRHLITTTANTVATASPSRLSALRVKWDTINYGAGIIDAAALLDAQLPPEDEIPEPPKQDENLFSGAGNLTDWFKDHWAEGEAWTKTFVAQKHREISRQVEKGLEAAEEAWIFFEQIAESAVGAIRDEARRLGREAANTWSETVEMMEDLTEDIVQDAENIVEDIQEGANEIVETGADVTEDVVNWLVGLIP